MNNLGTTFSPRQIAHLGLPLETSFAQALAYGFSVIRLGAYWSEIEREAGVYDFTALNALLQRCAEANQKVVLTVGVKAPRWPEYYWPDFIATKNPNDAQTQAKILHFLHESVAKLQHHTCITHWQVENEPLDPSGPEQLTIPHALLRMEVEVVKNMDDRPVLLTAWGNSLIKRGNAAVLASMSDGIGIDVYEKQYQFSVLGNSVYSEPDDSFAAIKKHLSHLSVPLWVMEVQAEPWEKDELAYHSDSPASMSPEKLESNLKKAQTLGATNILLFGFEYMLYRQSIGDNRYVTLLRQLLNSQA